MVGLHILFPSVLYFQNCFSIKGDYLLKGVKIVLSLDKWREIK